jgi:predicted nucleotide-binding protein
MPYYHVYISEVDEVHELDLSRENLLRYIVEPYLKNEEFMCSGSRIDPSEVDKIKISQTEKLSKELIPEARPKYASILGMVSGLSDEEIIMKEGKDVARQFITHLPRTAKQKPSKASQRPHKDIFIVHGRDHTPMKELKTMLLEFGLNPVVLHEQPSGSRTIVEKLEKYSRVGFAFVLLTPDDAGYCQYEKRVLSEDYARRIRLTLQRLRTLVKKEHELSVAAAMKGFVEVLRGRARQNVVFEFGYFVGLLDRDRVCCLYKGDVELPSDMHGIIYISYKQTLSEVKDEITKELKAAGYKLNVKKEVKENGEEELKKLKDDVEMLKRRNLHPR